MRTGGRNHVVIELASEMDRFGYGQTTGVRPLCSLRWTDVFRPLVGEFKVVSDTALNYRPQ